MLFNSIHFLIFFPIVTSLFFLLPRNVKWILLLVASYYFYISWKWEYIGLILFSTIVDYFVAIAINKAASLKRKKALLAFSLTSNLGLLFYFKYFNFFLENVNTGFQLFGSSVNIPLQDIILPVGISFYTFQTLSYTIEVYKERIDPEKNFLRFALYVSFFPQLVAGPIERPQNLLSQLQGEGRFNQANVVSGLRQILWGIFKKVVVADRLAFFVNIIYDNPADYHGPWPIIATIFFAFQIYCDFSGYSDVAIGAARIMNIDLMTNFKTPYFSSSIREFWGRWHISLSTWFRDYVYIPLGGNRVNKKRLVFNLLVTFVVSGIWHGAAWTFLVWGLIHGIAIAIETVFNIQKRLSKVTFLGRLYTLIIVLTAWVFFRAASVEEAFEIITNAFVWNGYQGELQALQTEDVLNLALGVGLIPFLLICEMIMSNKKSIKIFHENKWVRWSLYYLFIIIIMLFGVFVNPSDFIYFQF